MTDDVLPAYDKPPVNEVVLGVRFERIEGLTMPHFGIFWSQIKEEFSKCQHAEPILPIADASDTKTNLLLPRIWLVSNSDDYLLQLQQNLFYVNWREMKEDQLYPHYEKIIPMFYDNLDRYLKFISSIGLDRPSFKSFELAYVNIIPKDKGWEDPSDAGKLFPDIQWRSTDDRFLPGPKAIDWHAIFDLPDKQGRLTVKLQNVTRKSDGKAAFRFELNAQSLPDHVPEDKMSEWFDLAHKWIVSGFTDLTSDFAQSELWKRTDDSN